MLHIYIYIYMYLFININIYIYTHTYMKLYMIMYSLIIYEQKQKPDQRSLADALGAVRRCVAVPRPPDQVPIYPQSRSE